MNRFSYIALSFLAAVLRITPFPVISAMSSGLAFCLNRIVRYRRQTAVGNLQRCFPEKTAREINNMLPGVYRNITDVMLETIWAFYASPRNILKHFALPSKDEREVLFANYRGGVMASGHLANWELCGFCFHEVMPGEGIVAYRPLTNKRIDEMIRRFRAKASMKLAPMSELIRIVARNLSEPHYILLIADQSADPGAAQWEVFFGQQTPFFRGPAVIAHRYDLPVFFAYAKRIKRHQYKLIIEPLYAEPRSTTPEEITRLYVQKLEATIRKDPVAWLWTHRRWKHAPPLRVEQPHGPEE